MRGERLNDGLSVYAVGGGEPLVTLPGLGMGADLSVKVPTMTGVAARGLAQGLKRRVHAINRPLAAPEGMTIADLAGRYATALRERFEGPVDVMGTSAGGVTGLQLAMDHPEVVRRLIVCTASGRLGEHGKRTLLWLMEEERRGRYHPWESSGLIAQGPLRVAAYVAYGIAGLLGSAQRARAEGLLVEATREWDVTERLREIVAPTLVIAGTRDALVPPALAEATARGIRGGQLLMIGGGDHLSTMFDRRVSPAIRAFLDA